VKICVRGVWIRTITQMAAMSLFIARISGTAAHSGSLRYITALLSRPRCVSPSSLDTTSLNQLFYIPIMASSRFNAPLNLHVQTKDRRDGNWIHERSPPQHETQPESAWYQSQQPSTNYPHGPSIPEASECASNNAWQPPHNQTVPLQTHDGGNSDYGFNGFNGANTIHNFNSVYEFNEGPSQHQAVSTHDFSQCSFGSHATMTSPLQSSSGLPASHMTQAYCEADRQASSSIPGQHTGRRYVAV
jgi:hypothetical protein